MFNTAFGLMIVLVTSVTDGDTFRTDEGDRVRLWGIDAPEITTPRGVEAKRTLENILAREGSLLTCYVMGYDNYQRTVARCETGYGMDIGCELIRRGAAEEWEYYSRGEYADC